MRFLVLSLLLTSLVYVANSSRENSEVSNVLPKEVESSGLLSQTKDIKNEGGLNAFEDIKNSESPDSDSNIYEDKEFDDSGALDSARRGNDDSVEEVEDSELESEFPGDTAFDELDSDVTTGQISTKDAAPIFRRRSWRRRSYQRRSIRRRSIRRRSTRRRSIRRRSYHRRSIRRRSFRRRSYQRRSIRRRRFRRIIYRSQITRRRSFRRRSSRRRNGYYGKDVPNFGNDY